MALHGLVVRIVCTEPSIAATLESRFASFGSADGSTADITVNCDVDLAPHAAPDRRTGRVRVAVRHRGLLAG